MCSYEGEVNGLHISCKSAEGIRNPRKGNPEQCPAKGRACKYHSLWICSRAGIVCSFSTHSCCAVFPRRRGRSPIGRGQGPGPGRIVCLHASNVAPRNFGKIDRKSTRLNSSHLGIS